MILLYLQLVSHIIFYYILYIETPPVIEEQYLNTSSDNETSGNGFTKYLDLSKIPLCVSTYRYFCAVEK